MCDLFRCHIVPFTKSCPAGSRDAVVCHDVSDGVDFYPHDDSSHVGLVLCRSKDSICTRVCKLATGYSHLQKHSERL